MSVTPAGKRNTSGMRRQIPPMKNGDGRIQKQQVVNIAQKGWLGYTWDVNGRDTCISLEKGVSGI